MTPSGGASERRFEVITVYAIGLFQGLSLVAFPAAASILQSSTGYDLSKSRYGILFLPQVIMAIAGSLAMPTLSRRFRLKRVLMAGLMADTVAMALLVVSDPVRTDAIAYPMLLVATAALGLGFGLTLSSISTYAGAFMPDRRDVALTGLNVLLGLGTALSPLLIAIFLDIGEWWYLPLIAAAGLVVLIGLALVQPMVVPEATAKQSSGRIPALFWLFAAALVLYGIGETMFGNWGTTLLVGRGVKATSANNALAAFWASVTVGRLLIALSGTWVRSTSIYMVLPWAMAVALLLVPTAHTATAGILVFAFGGLACSGFFPMTRGLRRGHVPHLRRAGSRLAHRRLSGGLRLGRLRGRGPPEPGVAGLPLPGGRHPGRRDGRAGRGHRPPPTSRRPDRCPRGRCRMSSNILRTCLRKEV